MNSHADKTQENKNQSVANGFAQMEESSESAFQFVDNRPTAISQRKVQETANNSSKISQLRAFQEMANNSPQAKQTIQLQDIADSPSSEQEQPVTKKENNTGLPDNLKEGVENLSGHSMDDVKVHYNSDKPAQLQAHAYAQGSEIHLGSGQEKHLPHEAWHVVQQKQGRVKPTKQMKSGVNVNDDAGLENEADVMGGKALQTKGINSGQLEKSTVFKSTVQRIIKVEEKAGSSVLQEMTRLIQSGDKTLEEIQEDPTFTLLIMDTAANERNGGIGGVVDGNGLTLYKTSNLITVVVNVEECGEDMGKALRVLSHEVNIHAVNGYIQSHKTHETASPQELEDHVKILNLEHNRGRFGPIIEHRANVIRNLAKGLYLEDFTNFYNSWRSEINSIGRSSQLIKNEWDSALKKPPGERNKLQCFIVESLGESGNMEVIILEAKKAATAVCGEAFEFFLKTAEENKHELTEYDHTEIARLRKEFERGIRNDNPKVSAGGAVARLTREEVIALNIKENRYNLFQDVISLRLHLKVAPEVPDIAFFNLTLKNSIEKKPEASILVTDELLERLKRDTPTLKQGRFDVFVSRSEIESV